MWIKLIGANFSTNNIGTLKSYKVDTTGLVGLTVNPKYVSYKADGETISDVEFTFIVSSGYKFASGSTIKVGSDPNPKYTAESDLTADSKFTITMDVKSDIAFVGVAEKVAEPDVPTPDPEDPVNYTFTINPDPTSATVTLSATGYSTVSGTGSKSITVVNGTTVNWSVSADGYTTRTGTWIANGENKTESIVLIAAGNSGERVTIAEKVDYSIDGFCRPTNGTFGGTDTSYKRTDYIDITAYSALYAYCQPRAASVSPISFFTADQTWISGITPSGDLTTQQEFVAETIPENAVYAIFSGFASSNPLKAEGILK